MVIYNVESLIYGDLEGQDYKNESLFAEIYQGNRAFFGICFTKFFLWGYTILILSIVKRYKKYDFRQKSQIFGL